MADDNNSYELHESVFNGDTRRVSALIRTYDVSKKDKHGMTCDKTVLVESVR